MQKHLFADVNKVAGVFYWAHDDPDDVLFALSLLDPAGSLSTFSFLSWIAGDGNCKTLVISSQKLIIFAVIPFSSTAFKRPVSQ